MRRNSCDRHITPTHGTLVILVWLVGLIVPVLGAAALTYPLLLVQLS